MHVQETYCLPVIKTERDHMGNCLFGGLGDEGEVIKIIKSDGGVLEFCVPVTAGNITDEFPGHSIFPANNEHILYQPFSHDHNLVPGQSYYLLPAADDHSDKMTVGGSSHVRSNSETLPAITPYRMSLDYNNKNQRALKRCYTEVLSRNYYRAQKQRKWSGRSGVWKVKLAISPQQLLNILSHDGTTLDLMESIRAVANCGNAAPSSSSCSSSSVAFSDQWSLSSSRNASSKNDFDPKTLHDEDKY
ncbi:PREDICTED: uncharacterized protein LOC104809298 [Tarenaya hassleriana]|uniref:uncharacterized protein LOC104809298 n=1 Tax=Tarenaya hassleriana TaxID=28532 RepID=UPI00053C1985|nr:PREDICTED: uncharacterized protein LOC104809298 [Tarenaya hassleriana]